MGIIIACTGDGYVHLLTSENKILYSVINGSVNSAALFWKRFLYFLLPLIIMFILSLEYYVMLFSFLLVAYQSALLVMSMSAIISIYGFSGALSAIFLMLPVNILYIALLIIFACICFERSYNAKRCKSFTYGFNDSLFWIKVAICFVLVIILASIIAIIYPLLLKNAMFIIY